MDTRLERYVADIVGVPVSELDPALAGMVTDAETMVDKLGGVIASRQIAAIIVLMWKQTK